MPFMKGTVDKGEDGTLEPIAICGMACRLPGSVDSATSLWELLVNKRSGQTPKVPASRFNIDAHYHKNLERPGSFNVKGGYFLDKDLESFDPTFFNMTPIEAMWLDPQQRKMLEVCYEVLENAGLSLDAVSGTNTAVFVGCFTADYQQLTTKDPDFRHNYAATGVDPGIISNRIGNVFNLNGPSFTMNTACSSSVYATHMACHALRSRDCEAAIVGGVNLILTVDQHMNTAKLGILSPTSTCHTFDASADGYGRAEGAGAIYLKRLSDAIRDGDPIRSVIRSSAVNTNGKVPGMGITHPSMKGQERAVRQAYARAKLNPNNTAYLECHGTGTPVGDPIEVRAVANAMNDSRLKDKPLLLGAIKANIGHSEAASGVFAIMKAAMMTEAGIIPGVCGLKNLNPAIHETEWNIKIQKDTVPWPKGFKTKRAGVSSFGYGGTNGHVIVEEAKALCPFYEHGKFKNDATYDHSTSRSLLIGFSAHDKKTLTRNIEAHSKVASQFYLADLAHTLNIKRTRFPQRAFTIAKEGCETTSFDLSSFKFGSAGKPDQELGFIFTGQGAQWAGMGAEAIMDFPSFRDTIRALDRTLQACPHPPSWTLEQELIAPAETSRLSSAEIAQPALTAIQIAIVDLFASWSVTSAVAVGHSSGEMGAAYAAGLVSAPEAMLAAYYRGYALARHAPSGGTMLAIGLSVEEAHEKIPGLGTDPEVSCENSPASTTLSGSIAAIAQTKALLDAEKIFARELKTGQAYHSSHMKPVALPFVTYLEKAYETLDQDSLQWRQPVTRMISSVTATEISEDDINAHYWSSNLTSRVRFNEAVALLKGTSGIENVRSMIEIGPHSALAGPLKQICKANELGYTHIASFVRGSDCAISLLKTAGELFLQNYPVDLAQVNTIEQNIKSGLKIRKNLSPFTLVDLPPYQWNYEKIYFEEPRFSHEQRQLTHPRHDILGSRVVGLSNKNNVWRNLLRHRDVPWMKDHSLGGSAIFPAAGHLSLAIEAVRQICETKKVDFDGVTLRDVDIKTALVVPDTDDGIEIQVRVNELSKAGNTTWYSFAVESLVDDIWQLHCDGTLCPLAKIQDSQKDKTHPVDHRQLTQNVPGKRWYDAFHRVGFEYGPSFNQLVSVKTNKKLHSASANVKVLSESGMMDGESRYIIHPSTVDACLQLIIISIHKGVHKTMPWGVVPIGIEEVSLYFPENEASTQGTAVAWTDDVDGRYFNTHTKLQDANGNLVLDVKSLRCVAYEAAVPQNAQVEIIRQPYAGVNWIPDVATLTAMQAIQVFPGIASEFDSVTATVDLVDYKTPLSKVLVVGSDADHVPKDLLKKLPAKATVSYAGALELTSLESAPSDLILLTKDAFKETSFGRVLALAKPLLAEQGKIIFSIEGADREIAEENMEASGFASPALRFDLPDVTVILSTLSQDVKEAATEKQKVTLFRTRGNSQELAKTLDALSTSCDATIKDLKDYDEASDFNVIVVDLDGKILEDMDSATFDGIKNLLCSGTATVWLTAGVNKGVNVSGGMAQGLLRTLRAEQSRAKVTLVDVDGDTAPEDIASAALTKLETTSILDSGADQEFWLQKGIFYVNRILPNNALNAQFNADSEPGVESTLESGAALRGKISEGKMLFSQLEASPLTASQVEVQVSSFFLEGNAMSAFTGAPKLTAGSANGKNVLTYSSEAFSTVVRAESAQVVKAKGDLEKLVATLPALCRAVNTIGVSNLKDGQHVVLVAPSADVLEVYINLSNALGFKLSTVSTSQDFRTLATQGLSLTAIAFEFQGLGHDIWRYMPGTGRFVLSEAAINEAPDPLPFARGASFTSSNLSNLHKQSPAALASLLGKSLELVENYPELLVQPPQVVDINDAMSAPSSSSVISFGYGKSTIKVQPAKQELRLSPDATYILVGCLGGLGRSLTTLMMEKGTRNFAFISRSGADKPEAAHLVASLIDAGADVQVFRADASDVAEVSKVVAGVSANRKISGVVHAAMVLKDAMFGHTMSLQDFNTALAPKVKGAQALDKALAGHDLDFFIMTSSVSGTIGNPGQTNYSAANSYLDTLAYHRNLNGLPATSLVLPMILDVGVVAESDTLESKITRKGWYGIDEREMLLGFETAMLQPSPKISGKPATLADAQIILGVEPQYFANAISASDDVGELYWLHDARFSSIRREIESFTAGSGKQSGSGDFLGLVQEAQKSGDKAAVIKVIAEHLMKKCSGILMVPLENFEFESGSIASYGLDSMIGAELRNWLFKEFGLDISFQLLLAPTLTFRMLSITVGEILGVIEKAA